MNNRAHEWSLRAPVRSDAAALAALHVEVWRSTYGNLLGDEHFGVDAVRSRETMWASILTAPSTDGTVVVADVDGTLIGFAHTGTPFETTPARPVQLHSLYLAHSWQGHGIGTRLMDHALDQRPAQLWVASANTQAQAFYIKHGFEPDGLAQSDGPLTEIRLVR